MRELNIVELSTKVAAHYLKRAYLDFVDEDEIEEVLFKVVDGEIRYKETPQNLFNIYYDNIYNALSKIITKPVKITLE